MSDSNEQLRSTCNGICDELEAAVDGRLYYDGSNYIMDLDDWKAKEYLKKLEKFKKENPKEKFDPEETGYDTYDEWIQDEVGTVDDVDDPDNVSLSEYIEQQSLGDVRYEVDSSKELSGGKILFCYGGPTVWVHDDCVCGYWGGGSYEVPLNSDCRSALYDYLNENWELING